MEFIRYTPCHYDLLLQRRQEPHFPAALLQQNFVDWYYTGTEGSSLFLFVDKGEVAGLIGVECLSFAYEGQAMQVAASNNHVAFMPGIGGLQLLYWMKMAPYTLVFGGSAATHAILRQYRWHFFPPVPLLLANRRGQASGSSFAWRNRLKGVLARCLPEVRLARSRAAIRREGGGALQVSEESSLQPDMLPTVSPFRLRLAPSLDYLRWRYDPRLSFVRYRLFRIADDRQTIGYVILKESPEQILVSQCDGDNALQLACGVLLALAEVTERDLQPREMVLSCCHALMQGVFLRHGFYSSLHRRPFVMGSAREPLRIEHNTRQWLINFDWNDNGLRPPFLHEAS
ncbi:MAG: hypothetical protein HQM06_02300 [Magnetococcales bacterium]|nr:hypothetical protein [Magnetococcales bacterium]